MCGQGWSQEHLFLIDIVMVRRIFDPLRGLHGVNYVAFHPCPRREPGYVVALPGLAWRILGRRDDTPVEEVGDPRCCTPDSGRCIEFPRMWLRMPAVPLALCLKTDRAQFGKQRLSSSIVRAVPFTVFGVGLAFDAARRAGEKLDHAFLLALDGSREEDERSQLTR